MTVMKIATLWLRTSGLKHKLIILYFLMFLLPVGFFLYLIRQLTLSCAIESSTFVGLSLAIGIPAAIIMSVAAFGLIYHSIHSIEKVSGEAESFMRNIRPLTDDRGEIVDEAEKISRYVADMITELKDKIVDIDRHAKELNTANQQLVAIAIHDGLTGLFNHKYMKQALSIEFERSVRYRHPMSVVIFDLDDFKKFNDTHGHPVGDRLLRDVAGLIRKAIRPIDFPARYGGEEFLLILPETGLDEARRMADRIRQTIGEYRLPLDAEGHTAHITVSAGVGAYYNGSAPNVDTVVSLADASLYKAKRAGKNQVCA